MRGKISYPAANTLRMYHHKRASGCPFARVHTSRGGGVMLQLCTMATVHYNNAVWVVLSPASHLLHKSVACSRAQWLLNC